MNKKSALKKIQNEKFKQLCEVLLAEINRIKIPGASIGVWHQGKEQIAGFGKTSIEHPLPVTPETLFQIGSNTKPMVATAVMKLVEMGKLNPDNPIKIYLPDLTLKDKNVQDMVTMRHLLNHTAGWEGDYFNDFGTGDDALKKMMPALGSLNQMTPLGEIWSYNNAAFYIAGRVIEVLTEKPFETAIQELVFEPLGMDMSFFYPDDMMITHRFAIGHDLIKKKNKVARPWAIPRASAPAGGVIATAQDMLTFARFHMGDGNNLITKASIKAMQKPTVSTGNEQMGISWFVQDIKGVRVIHHGGATNGQKCGFWLIPEYDFALILLTNSSETQAERIFKQALRIYFDIAEPAPVPLELPTRTLQALTGKYENIEVILTVRLKENELWVEYEHKGGFPTPESPPLPVPPPMRVGVYESDKIITLDEPLKDRRGEFLRAPDGTLTWFRYGSRIRKKIQ